MSADEMHVPLSQKVHKAKEYIFRNKFVLNFESDRECKTRGEPINIDMKVNRYLWGINITLMCGVVTVMHLPLRTLLSRHVICAPVGCIHIAWPMRE